MILRCDLTEAGERAVWTRACQLKKGDRVGGDADISAAMKIQAKIGAGLHALWSAIEAIDVALRIREKRKRSRKRKACRSRTGQNRKIVRVSEDRAQQLAPTTSALQPIELGVSNLGSRCASDVAVQPGHASYPFGENMTIQIFSF